MSQNASVFSAKSIVRSERVKALKGSMPRESLIASIKSTHSDSFLSLARLFAESLTLHARNINNYYHNIIYYDNMIILLYIILYILLILYVTKLASKILRNNVLSTVFYNYY